MASGSVSGQGPQCGIWHVACWGGGGVRESLKEALAPEDNTGPAGQPSNSPLLSGNIPAWGLAEALDLQLVLPL